MWQQHLQLKETVEHLEAKASNLEQKVEHLEEDMDLLLGNISEEWVCVDFECECVGEKTLKKRVRKRRKRKNKN